MPHHDQPTETDGSGNVNNVYTAPPKPSTPPSAEAPEPVNGANGSAKPTMAPIADAAADFVAQINPDPVAEPTTDEKDASTTNGKPIMTKASTGTTFPQLVSDLASTIAAADGTTSTYDYVTSGLGAAIQGVVGIDPINADKVRFFSHDSAFTCDLIIHTDHFLNTKKIAVETPKPDGKFVVPEPEHPAEPVAAVPMFEEKPPIPEQPQAAPIVPISIIPVNASENNLIPVETPKDVIVSTSDAPQEEISSHMALPELTSSPPPTAVEVSSAITETAPAAEAAAQPPTAAATLSEPEPPIVVTEEVAAPPQSIVEPSVQTENTSIPVDIPPEVISLPPPAAAEPEPAVTQYVADATPESKPEELAILSVPVDSTAPVAELPPDVMSKPPTATVLEPEPAAVPEPPALPAAEPLAAPEPETTTAPKPEETSVVPNGAASSDPPAEAAAPSTPTPSAPATPAASAPSTPAKNSQHAFPSSESPASDSSPSSSPSSKFSTSGSRKKRTSIFGKISLKGIFGHDKEKK